MDERGREGAALLRVLGDGVCLGEGFLSLLDPSSTLVGSQGVLGTNHCCSWQILEKASAGAFCRPHQIEQGFDEQGGDVGGGSIP